MSLAEYLQDRRWRRERKGLLGDIAETVGTRFDILDVTTDSLKRPEVRGFLEYIHQGPYPQGIIGVPFSQASDEQKSELEELEAWERDLAKKPNKDGYKRLITVYGSGLDKPNKDSSVIDVVLVSEAYDISKSIDKILKAKPELQETYKRQDKEWFFFVNYGFTGEGKNIEARDTIRNRPAVKNIELAVLDQITRLSKELKGSLVGGFFECENPDKIRDQGGEVTASMYVRPKLFSALSQKMLGRGADQFASYVQPPLAEGADYCYGLSAYFLSAPGYVDVPAIRKLAFIDRFYEYFTDKGVDQHLSEPKVREMYDSLMMQITAEHQIAKQENKMVGQLDKDQCVKDFGKASYMAAKIIEPLAEMWKPIGDAVTRAFRGFSSTKLGSLVFWGAVGVSELGSQGNAQDHPNYRAESSASISEDRKSETASLFASVAGAGGPPDEARPEKKSESRSGSPILDKVIADVGSEPPRSFRTGETLDVQLQKFARQIPEQLQVPQGRA